MKLLYKLLLLVSTVAISLSASAADTLKIAVTPGVADPVKVAAAEAKKQGIDVKIIEFNDWVSPNAALDAGDVDANYFQHQAYLDQVVRDAGYKIHSLKEGLGVLPNIGLYSKRIKNLNELKDGATVAVANDPVNLGRGLLLFQKAGLIKLKPNVGDKASLFDIIDNPKKLKFVELEGPQLVRSLDDVDLAEGFPQHFVFAGQAQLAGNALIYSGIDDVNYAWVFVVKDKVAVKPELLKFIQIYQTSPEVLAAINKTFANNPRLYTLAWKK